ncbi:RluA family pseudouridine synthase [Aciduricibacillus chroicocephali]|uniref:Pseudouridine synthase n=1 Tax=Aciduricibacillus chroicocephali TaxID=3054939 RepID=A0ABY9KZC1_9BACI|nr:RluA family pseudouridine synthase [Bacillaceae bacterium 44XB]
MRTVWIVEQEADGEVLKNYLRENKGFSRRLLKAMKAEGGKVLVNGLDYPLSGLVSSGDKVECILLSEERGHTLLAEPIPLSIKFEDDYLLIVDKLPGMAVIPSRQHPSGTVANALLAHYDKQGLNSTVHVVTRLDKDTSGLVLVAKNRYIHSLLSVSQKAGQISRTYEAVVEGHFEEEASTIDLPIGRKEGSIIERAVNNEGQEAVTHYKVLRSNNHLSLLSVKLETGRTHQIRVHFSHIGHPLAGDTLYGGGTEYIKRQALHCEHLSFSHPVTGEDLHFSSDLPEDIQLLIREMN